MSPPARLADELGTWQRGARPARPAARRRRRFGTPDGIDRGGAGGELRPTATRMREYRRRGRAGVVVVDVEIGPEEIETLIEARLLGARWDFHPREEIAAAITAFLRLSRYA